MRVIQRYISIACLCLFPVFSFALTENEAKQCIKNYYSLLQQYANDVSKVYIVDNIQSLFIDGKGSVYNDIFTNVDGNPDTDGDVQSYISSIEKYHKDRLTFSISNLSVSMFSYDSAKLNYRKIVGSNAGKISYVTDEEALIKGDKILCIYKKGTGKTISKINSSITISSVQVAGADGDGNAITSYGATLEKEKIARLRIKIDYFASDDIKVLYKLIHPSGREDTSPLHFHKSQKTYFLKWGWKSLGNYAAGNYKIELRRESDNKLLYTHAFSITSAQATYLTASSSLVEFESYGGTRTITISCDKDWVISTDTYSWGHLTRNGNILTLKVDANTSSSTRTDYFVVKSGTKEARVNISQKGAKTVDIDNVWVDHNVPHTTYSPIWNGFFWQQVPQVCYLMRIHVKFHVAGRQGENLRVCAFFYHQDGSIVRGSGNFRASNGQATVQGVAIPSWENTDFSDFLLGIPYSAMHNGIKHDLKFRIEIQSSAGTSLATSDWLYFSL